MYHRYYNMKDEYNLYSIDSGENQYIDRRLPKNYVVVIIS